MKDRELRDAYAALFRERPATRTACPSPERLRALVEQAGPEDDRLETLDHVMRCGACRPEFDLLQAATAARPVPARRYPVPLAAAAALALAISAGLLWRATSLRRAGPDPIRGAAGGVDLVAPAPDASGRPDRFVWRSSRSSGVYVLEVFDQAGDRVFGAETADTVVRLPDSVSLAPGQPYHWWVITRWPDGRESRATTQTFRP